LTSSAEPHDQAGGMQGGEQTADAARTGPSGRYGPDAGRAVPVSDLVVPDSNGVVEVIHHESERFYELLDGGASVALLVYEKNSQQTGITHAMVREDRRKHGFGTTLIATALPDLARSGGKITNYCDSVARFLGKHPDYKKFANVEH
jgi:predicted GNAT family acetyltransferase